METVDLTYDGYVRAYRVLAHALGVAPDELWRDLWAAGIGRVRAAFPHVLGRLRTELRSPSAAAEVLEVADQVFATARLDQDVAGSQLE